MTTAKKKTPAKKTASKKIVEKFILLHDDDLQNEFNYETDESTFAFTKEEVEKKIKEIVDYDASETGDETLTSRFKVFAVVPVKVAISHRNTTVKVG